MDKRSAGLLMYRKTPGGVLEVLLAHPGGPFFAKKDDGSWSIPKGECAEGEEPFSTAQREFVEETGFSLGSDYLPLGEVKQSGGKTVSAWAFCGDCDPATLVCNTFELEWPPRSGKRQTFPEIDRVQWFSVAGARKKILAAQSKFLDTLEIALLGGVQSNSNDSPKSPPTQNSLF